MKTILLVDGSAMLYRAFYGLAPLKTLKGIPTQAVYGFLRSLGKCLRLFEPDFLLVAWDSQALSLRKQEYVLYKATRQAAPDDLILQKNFLTEILARLDVQQITADGYEADDIIFTVQKRALQNFSDAKVVVVTPDKDLFQLCSENVVIYDAFKDIVFDENKASEKLGFHPIKLNFFHSLVGDASDNIPGVAGVGKVSATKLVHQFFSLKELYENLKNVSSEKVKKCLIVGRENAFLSERLFTLSEIKDLVVDFSKIEKVVLNFDKSADLLQELELVSFLPKREQSQIVSEPLPFEVNIIRSHKDLFELQENILSQATCLAIDLETTGLSWLQDSIVAVSVAFDTKKAFYIPIAHINYDDKSLVPNQVLLSDLGLFLEKIFASNILKLFHNQKFDLHFLKQAFGFCLNGPFFDTAIAARICLPEWVSVGLKSLAKSELNFERSDLTSLLKKYGPDFRSVPVQIASEYGALDVVHCLQLHERFVQQFEKMPRLGEFFWNIEMPLAEILLDMEHAGISLDLQKVKDLTELVEGELEKCLGKVNSALKSADLEDSFIQNLNINSPKQLQHLLFEVLSLPIKKKSGKSGQYSTDNEVLSQLETFHPIPALILEYRKLSKIKSTYLDPLQDFFDEKTSAVHTQYSQLMVSTGRLSSLEPNLQNVPQVGSLVNVRSCFVARPGKVFLSADYSQIELRVLAYLCKDSNLISAFQSGQDIHLNTAIFLFNKDSEAIKDEERALAKKINFSILYGLSPYSLSQDLKISSALATEYINSFFQAYPAVKNWIQASLDRARENGFIETVCGRRRWFRYLNDKNQNIAKAEQRAAINAIVQGSAAELLKMAMIKMDKVFKSQSLGAKILLQVHDEVLVEVEESDVDLTLKTIQEVMTTVVCWEVPLEVNFKIGQNWGVLRKISMKL